jgi:chemotaxis protein MotB
MNADNTDENVGWPSYVDFLASFIFLLILFIGSLVFQVSGVIEQRKKTQTLKHISELMGKAGIANSVRQNKILIPLDQQVTFPSNSSMIDSSARDHLRNVGLQIAKACSDPQVRCRRILVEGHADNVPVKNDPEFGNWKLSANRALEVLRFFYRCRNCGYGEEVPARLALSGQGAVDAKNSTSGNVSDRRVDVILDYGKERDQ